MSNPPLLSRTVIILSLVSLLTDIASEMLYPVSPLFLRSIGFSMMLIGILEGLAETVAGLSKGYFGAVSDRVNRRVPFVQIGYALSAVSRPLIGLFPNVPAIFAARTLDRLGKGVRTVPRDAILVAESSTATRGRVFGFHRGCDTLGAAIGPTIAMGYLTAYPGSYRMLYLIAFLPAFAGFLTTLTLPRESRPAPPSAVSQGITKHMREFLENAPPQYKKLLIAFLTLSLVNSSDVFILLKGKDSGLSDATVLLSYIFYNLAYALLSFPFGALADRIGFKKIYLSGVLLFAAVYFLLGWQTTPLWFWIAMGLYAAYAAASEGIAKAWLSTTIPAAEKGTGLGVFQMLSTLTFLVASPLTGILWTFGGASLPFYAISAASIFCALYIAIVVKPFDKHQINN